MLDQVANDSGASPVRPTPPICYRADATEDYSELLFRAVPLDAGFTPDLSRDLGKDGRAWLGELEG